MSSGPAAALPRRASVPVERPVLVRVRKRLDAIFRLGAVIDDTPEELATSKSVMIQAMGNVRPGALILADSRLCENPTCFIEFVPRHPRQRFHSARCRELNRRGGK